MTKSRNKTHTILGKVLTANVLVDGVVVYLAAGGTWTENLPEARFLTDESEQTRLVHIANQDVEKQFIIDPYLMDAVDGGHGPEPVSQRENIRATGPTIPTNFNSPQPES